MTRPSQLKATGNVRGRGKAHEWRQGDPGDDSISGFGVNPSTFKQPNTYGGAVPVLYKQANTYGRTVSVLKTSQPAFHPPDQTRRWQILMGVKRPKSPPFIRVPPGPHTKHFPMGGMAPCPTLSDGLVPVFTRSGGYRFSIPSQPTICWHPGQTSPP